MAGNVLMGISQDARERAIFRSRRMYWTDYESDMATSYDNGRQEGRQEGIEIGEHRRSLEVAKSMLADGEPVDKITRYTGMTPEEIERIRSEDA